MSRAALAAGLLAVVAAAGEVRPQDDLFGYANAAWLAHAEIPPDRVTCGLFAELSDKTEADLRTIIEDVIAGRTRVPASTRQEISDLYRSATDEARLEQLGAAPLAPELARIDAIRTPSALAVEMGYLSSIGVGGPFDGGVVADPARSGAPVVRVLPGGTLLPDLRYYLDDDSETRAVREAYRHYLGVIFTLTSRDDAVAAAGDVLALETELARAQWSDVAAAPADGRFTVRDLEAAMPGFDWSAWARPQGLDRAAALVLVQPAFFRRFASLVPRVALSTWRNWLIARSVTAAAPFLGSAFDVARFDFFGRTLTGQREPRVRWRRGVTMVSAYLGDAIGRLYVERHLSPPDRKLADRVAASVLAAARATLREATDLEAGAKRHALASLGTMTVRVGAPERWRSYDGLIVRSDDLLGNWLRALAFDGAHRVRTAGAAADGTWAQPPQTVNAYYAAATNEIVVPAALLQPPILDARADEALNYGALGALVGHEVAHALGASEASADAVGLALAYRAFMAARKGQPLPVVDGATGEQRFFLSWARMWRSKERVEYLRSTESGGYRSGAVRANGAVAAVDGFYNAFGVGPGDRLYRPPAERIGIR
jgi:predicted metalloendopeptidase